jgi:SNF family Na+-dependent transporter
MAERGLHVEDDGDMTDQNRPPQRWGTRLGVILAVMGSAVGLGNFLRFPGLAAKYEGGAFMIPYFVALLLLGLPMAWAEWAMGRYGGRHGFNSTPGIYRTIWKRNPLAPYFGVLGMLVPVVIYMYYVFIEAWCLGYAWHMLTGELSLGHTDKKPYVDFFVSYVGLEQNGSMFTSAGTSALTFLVICFVLNFVLIYRGLTKGIEWFCKWAMPALVVCAFIVLVRVLTMPGIEQGLGFMWNPRTESKSFLEHLGNGQMWLEATGQIFFSLSVGFGIVITYASYLRKDDDVALSSLTSVAGNEFCEVALGGLITIPAAFILLGPKAGGSTFDLGFMTLPMVFEAMPAGRAIGFIFFFLLFLAAVTSSLSMLQPAIALLEEGLGLERKSSVALLGFITAIGTGFVVYFSQGLTALDHFDFWVGTLCIYVLATFQVIMFGWVLGLDKGMEEINRGAAIRVPALVGFILKYVSPLYLILVFVLWLKQQVKAKEGNYFLAVAENRVAQFSVIFLLIVAVLFTLLVARSVRRWKQREQTQGGERV